MWHRREPSSSGGSWQQLWVPVGRVSGVCFPEGWRCFPEAPAAGERTWGSASPLVLPGTFSTWLIPRAVVGGRLVSAMVAHLPVPLDPVQGVGGHLSPHRCCRFLCCSRKGNGQERVIGAKAEGCRGNEVASGQPAALIHIPACSCVAPGLPPTPWGRRAAPLLCPGLG